MRSSRGKQLYGFKLARRWGTSVTSSIPPAHSQGEDCSSKSSRKDQICSLNCKIFPDILGYFDLDAEDSHRP